MLSSIQTKQLLPIHSVQDISIMKPEDFEQTQSNKFHGSLRRLKSFEKIVGDEGLDPPAA